MLGKRPRPILRTTSKSQLMTNNPSDCPPVLSEEHMGLPSPMFVAPRLVIGFNPVSQKLDCEESPRSVMEPKALAASHEKQARSPRSPRSGLESLLSSPRPSDVEGCGEVSLGIPATIHDKEDNAAKGGYAEFPQEPIFLVSELVSYKCCSTRSSKPSQPIPIFPTHSEASSRGKIPLIKTVHEDDHNASVLCREEMISQTRDFSVVLEDEVMEKHHCIFSTASPASSCNEYSSEFALIDFLKACFFCKRPLAPGKDIFMYRGDRAFCTAECRYKQIVIDERKERYATDKVLAATTAAAA